VPIAIYGIKSCDTMKMKKARAWPGKLWWTIEREGG
jgi:hypothetical protein